MDRGAMIFRIPHEPPLFYFNHSKLFAHWIYNRTHRKIKIPLTSGKNEASIPYKLLIIRLSRQTN
jgi:hypothetical protein